MLRRQRRFRNRVRKATRMGAARPFRSRRRRPMTKVRVLKIIDAELKVRDLGFGPVFIPSITGDITLISNVGQGDLNTQRNGNWIKPTTLMGTITLKGNTVADPILISQFRVGVACWKENQTLNAFSIDQIMQDTAAPHQQYNIENKGQFKILWSRTGILSNVRENPQYLKVLRFYVKPPLKVLYDDADFKNNQLFLFAYSDIDTAVNPPTLSAEFRLRYTDS